MATSGTTTFDMDVAETIEEAFERCGSQARTGYDFRTARRSLNLLFIEWANQGVNMWTIDEGTIPLVAGVKTYDLPLDTIDILDAALRSGAGVAQNDSPLSRVSFSTYAMMPNKETAGTPSLMKVTRHNAPSVTLWPVPQGTTPQELVYWRMRRMQDAASGVDTMDMPFRFLPALVAGLAHKLALKIPEAAPRLPELEKQYITAWDLATGEDRERATLRLVPRIAS
jgi:hypothetical protein